MPGHRILSATLALILSAAPLRAEVSVTTPADLATALASAPDIPNQTLRLAPGDYGALTLPAGAEGLTIASADPGHPARFSALAIRDARNITLDGLAFHAPYQAGAPLWANAFAVTGSRDITIRNSSFDGALVETGNPGAGYATGKGLILRDVTGATLQGDRLARFHTGLTLMDSADITLTGSEITAMRSDGLNVIACQRVIIGGNRFHDFHGLPGGPDHRDMIQIWTTGTHSPTTDLTIRGNLFDIGQGSWTQSIFIRNEEVDLGRAGPEMFYRNLLIEQNTIYNAHLHGISVGEADGLIIRHNALIALPDSSATAPDATRNPRLWVPVINISKAARNVTITDNATAAINAPIGLPGWTVAHNVVIQRANPTAPGYYGAVFTAASMAAQPHAYIARPNGPLGSAGSDALHPPPG